MLQFKLKIGPKSRTRPDPLGELTALARSPSWIKGKGKEWEDGREGEDGRGEVKKGYRGRGRSRGGTGIKGGRWDGRKKDYPPPI